jgi:hypothetical protein
MGNPKNKEVPNITISSCEPSNASDEIATSLRSSQ